MSYREKCAWLMLTAILITFGPYFIIVATSFSPAADEPMPNMRLLSLYASAAISQMLIIGVGHIVLRWLNPEEAKMPLDERDRDIKRNAVSVAYYILISGMILVGVIMPFLADGWEIANPAIATIAIAEVVHYTITVISYRKQA